jgi:hypothetical protein
VLIVDDLFLKLPWKSVLWVLEQLRRAADAELVDERPVLEAILESELRFEEGRVDRATYDEEQQKLMARLREIRERKRAMAEGDATKRGAPISGKASLEVDVDFQGYGERGEEGR